MYGAEVVEGKVAEEGVGVVEVEVKAERAEVEEVGEEAGEAGAQLREKGEVDS